MINAFLILAGSQLAGEILRRVFNLPLPGPVIGMLILATVLILKNRKVADESQTEEEAPVFNVANGLVSNMGLLFVPAGVGIMSEFDLVQHYWLPILCGLVLSTLLGLLATAAVMHHMLERKGSSTQNQEGT